MARCLVIGGNGFLGSYLVDTLVKQNHHVTVFDRFREGTFNFLPSNKIDIIAGDFLNRYELSSALKAVEYVFHFLSTTTPFTAENDPLIDIDTNVRMSVELFEECVSHKVKKVIFASTGGAIYGDNNKSGPISEDTLPAPVSPYAIGKLSIEHYLRYFKTKYDLKSTSFRISNPYGERQSPASKQGIIPIFLHHIANGEPLIVYGDGSMIRDYIYAEDVAILIAASFEIAKSPVYNLGSGQGTSLNELLKIIGRTVGKPLTVSHEKNHPTFVKRAVLDTTLFQKEFGLVPQTCLEEGIEKTWKRIKMHTGGKGS